MEQRIGRCHRYGQKYDVVVVNFLNETNLADKRIFELLDEKFKLFDGVFGASDEILGSVESGIDLEKRVVQIYRQCRTPIEIEKAFDDLQKELDEQINSRLQSTRKTLLENFDEEVHEKLKLNLSQAREYISKLEEWLWQVTVNELWDFGEFNEEEHSFVLINNPYTDEAIPLGKYLLKKGMGEGYAYHLQHPLAQQVLKASKQKETPPARVVFSYSDQPKKISVLEPLIRHSGVLGLSRLQITALEKEDHLIFVGHTESGVNLTTEQAMRLFSLPGDVVTTVHEPVPHDGNRLLSVETETEMQKILVEISERNANFFEEEIDKLDKWADDKRNSLKFKLKDLDNRISELKKEARLAPNLPSKLEMQKKIRELEVKRDQSWLEFDQESKKIESEKDKLIDMIEKRLKQSTQLETLFTIQWEIV